MKSNRKKINKKEWLVPAGLILLSIIPVIAGAARIAQLGGGAEVTPDNARFFASPLPVVLHILSVSLYCIIGAFQFAPSLRRWKPGWHQTIGRWLLVPAGLVAALSGLWMTQFYPWPDGDGVLLYAMRLFFGSAMLLAIILGVVAVRRRDYDGHGEWMIRGYAIGLGAGTQVLTHIPMLLFPDIVGVELPRAIMMGAGWIINIIVAEWIIRKRRTSRQSRSTRTASLSA